MGLTGARVVGHVGHDHTHTETSGCCMSVCWGSGFQCHITGLFREVPGGGWVAGGTAWCGVLVAWGRVGDVVRALVLTVLLLLLLL